MRRFFFELVHNYADLGEDRTRNFYWTIPPHWGKHLYDFEIRSMPQKYLTRLFYTDFMRMSGTKGLKVPMHKINIRLDSRFNVRTHDFRKACRNAIKNLIMNSSWSRRLFYRWKNSRPKGADFAEQAALLRALHGSLGKTKSWIDPGDVERFIAGEGRVQGLNRLIGLLLFFRELERRCPSKLVSGDKT